MALYKYFNYMSTYNTGDKIKITKVIDNPVLEIGNVLTLIRFFPGTSEGSFWSADRNGITFYIREENFKLHGSIVNSSGSNYDGN